MSWRTVFILICLMKLGVPEFDFYMIRIVIFSCIVVVLSEWTILIYFFWLSLLWRFSFSDSLEQGQFVSWSHMLKIVFLCFHSKRGPALTGKMGFCRQEKIFYIIHSINLCILIENLRSLYSKLFLQGTCVESFSAFTLNIVFYFSEFSFICFLSSVSWLCISLQSAVFFQ